MSNDVPDWLEDITDDDEQPEKPKRKKKRAAPSPKKQGKFSAFQLTVLVLLGLILCGICAGGALTVYSAQNSPPAVVSANVEPPATALPSPTPGPAATPVNTPTPRPTATSMLPQPGPSAEPSATATYAVAPDFINKDKIKDITRFVEEWRELSLPAKIPIKFITRAQLREQWRDESFDVETLEAVQTRQQFYAALGLIEPDVDFLEAVFDSQAGSLMGYYTPEEKMMVVIAESVNMFAQEELTFAHEYVHALQDHHFNLNSLLATDLSGDAFLAARSLPEGDARLLEDIFALENVTQDQLDYSVYRYLFQNQDEEIEGVSPALSIFTYFPYTAGEYFSLYLFTEAGYSWDLVNQAYTNPPVSSEQVMHPEKYLAGERPVSVSMPNLAFVLGDGWREVDGNVLGEAGFLVWLIDQVDEQAAINGAAGWDGDSYSLWMDGDNQRILAESSVWESAAEAREFIDTYKKYITAREPAHNLFEENGATIVEYNGGALMIKQQGRKVLIIIAPNRNLLYNVHNQFVDF